MESVELIGKNDVCRCCLKEEGSQDIFTDLFISKERKTYVELLKYTFDIQISNINDGNTLICETCSVRLKDAFTFKLMVLQSENSLLEYLRRLRSNSDDALVHDTDFKADVIKEATLATPFDTGCTDTTDSLDDDETLSCLKLELSKLDGATEPRSLKRKHDNKRTKPKRCRIEVIDEMASKEPPEKDWSKIAERRGNGPLLRENSLKLIQNSTVCVFQWNKSRYRCFCCKEPFSDMNLLKQHTENSHTLEDIEKRIILQQNRLVKVEISNLNCRICRQQLEDMSVLKRHLSETHGLATSEDLLVPFKIGSELTCQICDEKFTVFRLLNIHVNKHFQKQVCHICGAGFSNLVFFNLHRIRSHRPFPCKPCDITFNNKSDKKHHDIAVHNVKYERKRRFPCPYCPERFFQENFRVKHLIDSHGMQRPDFKCTVCPKSFLTRSLCNNHVKNVHNKEKNHECDVCHVSFYTNSDLSRHKVTHTGEKKFLCGMCNSPFATRDSLRRHMKKTHVGISQN